MLSSNIVLYGRILLKALQANILILLGTHDDHIDFQKHPPLVRNIPSKLHLPPSSTACKHF